MATTPGRGRLPHLFDLKGAAADDNLLAQVFEQFDLRGQVDGVAGRSFTCQLRTLIHPGPLDCRHSIDKCLIGQHAQFTPNRV